MTLVERYVDGVYPELDPDLLVEEGISRSAILREQIEQDWEALAEGERTLVRGADLVLIREAARLAPFWRQDMVADTRREESPSQAHWWWWLDQIAEGTYPPELLPEL